MKANLGMKGELFAQVIRGPYARKSIIRKLIDYLKTRRALK